MRPAASHSPADITAHDCSQDPDARRALAQVSRRCTQHRPELALLDKYMGWSMALYDASPYRDQDLKNGVLGPRAPQELRRKSVAKRLGLQVLIRPRLLIAHRGAA